MAPNKELQVQKKREVESKEESTVPVRTFVPAADIYEDRDSLKVILEMPGVEKGNVDVRIEEGFLFVEGHIDLPSIAAFSRSTPNTTSAIIRAASGFPTRSTETRSTPN